MQAVGGVAGVLGEIRVFKDPESNQRSQPLAVWRDLVNAKASIRLRRGLHPFSLMCPEVAGRQALAAGKRGNPARERSAIERLAICLCNLLERLRLIGKAERLPGAWRPTVPEKRLSKPRGVLEPGNLCLPLPGHDGRDKEPLTCVFNRWL